jgi:hypothetical protein
MPKISSQLRKPAEPMSAELYGSTEQTEEEEITDIVQIEVSNTVFLSISGLLFVCAIFLVRQLGFLPVMNGLFLCGSSIGVAMLELYQPPTPHTTSHSSTNISTTNTHTHTHTRTRTTAHTDTHTTAYKDTL